MPCRFAEQLETDIKTAQNDVKDAKASHKRVEIELVTMQDEIVEAQVCDTFESVQLPSGANRPCCRANTQRLKRD